MSVDNLTVIDFISEEEGAVVLTISDHLKWDSELEHVYTLQEKINLYLGAIESVQLIKKYPAAEGKKIIIDVALKYKPNKTGRLFLSEAERVIKNAGYGFRCYIYKIKSKESIYII